MEKRVCFEGEEEGEDNEEKEGKQVKRKRRCPDCGRVVIQLARHFRRVHGLSLSASIQSSSAVRSSAKVTSSVATKRVHFPDVASMLYAWSAIWYGRITSKSSEQSRMLNEKAKSDRGDIRTEELQKAEGERRER